jgi:hypothetical protein
MRRLLEKLHYGTACPPTDHVPRNTRNSFALYLRGAKIAITPLLISKPRARIPAGGEATKNSRERRIDTRVNMWAPFHFRILNSPNALEQTAESENISQRGILFARALPRNGGTPLEVSVKMPQELAGKFSSDVRCVARVVHVQPNAFLGGKAGIGLHMERYGAVAALAQER